MLNISHFSSKQDFRQFSKNNLKSNLKSQNSRYANRFLIKYLTSLIKQKGFKNILLFYPLNYEANILPLLKSLKKQKNKKIFLPSIRGLNFKMLPFTLPLRQNEYKIWEPKFSYLYLEKIDLAIIPALGIDSSFKRIGMGKGMYDRKFSEIKNLPYMIFVSQNLNIAKNKLTQDFDISADEYVSYKFRIKKGFKNDRIMDNKSSCIWSCGGIRRLSYLQKACLHRR